MADPLSIIGAIGSVIQISQVVVGYIKTAKGANSERQSLLAQINATTALCQTLKDSAEIDSSQWLNTLQSISKEEIGPLDSFKKTLEYLRRKLASAGKEPNGRLESLGIALKWPFEQTKLRDIFTEIERQKSLFTLALTNDNVKLSAAILKTSKDIAETVNAVRIAQEIHQNETYEIAQGIKGIQSYQEGKVRLSRDKEDIKKKQDILSALTTIDFEASHADISSRRAKDTGQWIVMSPEYVNWRDKDHPTILWCPGIPGAGKTVLASSIIDSLRQSKSVRHGMAGVYCSYQQSTTTQDLMGSILKQLLAPMDSLPKMVQSAGTDFNGVMIALKEVLSQYLDIYLVVDALDECPDAPGLLKHLGHLVDVLSKDLRRTNLRILILGRHSVSGLMERTFNAHERLEIKSKDEDVRKYLQQSIRDHYALSEWTNCDKDFESLIVDSILGRLSGMFLLARLYVDILVHIPTKRGVRKALSTLPTGIDNTYTEAWNRVLAQRPEQAELGKHVLLWVVNAVRPLRKQELEHALAVKDGDEELDVEGLLDARSLSSFCAGLVVINDQSNLVSLVHPTTQEYFEKHKEDLLPRANEEIATVCITYLCMRTFSDQGALATPEAFHQRWSSNPLLGYAAVNWGLHVRSSRSQRANELSLSLLRQERARLAASQALVLNTIGTRNWGAEWPDLWRPTLEEKPEFEKCDSTFFLDSIHLASYFGLVDSVRVLLQEGCEVDALDGFKGTSIHWTLTGGQHEMLDYLLDHGANPNHERDPCRLRRWDEILAFATPLGIAASNGDNRAIESLTEHGADVNLWQSKAYSWSALSIASYARKHDTVRLLLQKGADVNLESRSIFEAAIGGGHDTLKLFIEAGVRRELLHKALVGAAETGQYKKVTLPLEHGAKADGPADTGDAQSEDFYQEQQSDTSEEDYAEDDATPLVNSIAGRWGNQFSNHFRCFLLLLHAGANINRISSRDYLLGDDYIVVPDGGWFMPRGRKTTALLTAAYFGHLNMIRILVQRGADVNFSLGKHNTALSTSLRAESFERKEERSDMDLDLESLKSSSLQTRATLQLLMELGADPDLCTQADQERITQLLNMTDQELDDMAAMERLALQSRLLSDRYGKSRHPISFHERVNRLREIIDRGVDPGLCCERDRKRISEMLQWSESEIDLLDRQRNESRAYRKMLRKGPL